MKIVLAVIILYIVMIFIGSGYYFSGCSCSFRFYAFKPQSDCARMCSDTKPMTNFQQRVNTMLLKNAF